MGREGIRRRATVVLALGAIVAAGALGGQAAAAPQGQQCPNGWSQDLRSIGDFPGSESVDKNGDGWVCFKTTGNQTGNIVDNKIALA